MISYPFESQNTGTSAAPVYDRAITAEQERTFNKLRYVNGVFQSPANNLQVVADNGMTIKVMPGGCHIEGALGYETTQRSFTISAAHSSLARIDRIVARFDTSVTERKIDIYKKEGTPSNTPVAPEVVQQANYYEIALADIRVAANTTSITNSNITDQRLNSAVCGQVVPAIPTPLDFTDLYAQYQASLDEYLEIVEQAIDETLAGNLQAQITANATNVATNAADITQLETDTAISAETLAAYEAIGFDPADYPGGGQIDKLDRFIKNRLGVQMVKVWENASPGSNFAAQTISLDLSDGAFVLVKTGLSQDPETACLNTIAKLGDMTEQTFLSSTWVQNYRSRKFKALTTGITFQVCYMCTYNGAGTVRNEYAIPLEIYLIRVGVV